MTHTISIFVLNAIWQSAVLFLVATKEGPAPRVRSRDEHHSLLLDVDVPVGPGKTLRLTIVVVGRYKEG